MNMYEQLKEQFIQADRPYTEGAVDVFEQVISVTESKKITKATLCMTALGVYEAELNGEKVGDILFALNRTKRIMYSESIWDRAGTAVVIRLRTNARYTGSILPRPGC